MNDNYLVKMAEKSFNQEKKFYSAIRVGDAEGGSAIMNQMNAGGFYNYFKSNFNDFQKTLKSLVYGQEIAFVDELARPGFYVNFRNLSRISTKEKSEDTNEEEASAKKSGDDNKREGVSADLASKRIKDRLNSDKELWIKSDQVFKDIGSMIFKEAKMQCQGDINVLLPVLGQYAMAALKTYGQKRKNKISFKSEVLGISDNVDAKKYLQDLKGSIDFSQQDLKAIIKRAKQDKRTDKINFELLGTKKEHNILGVYLERVYDTKFENEEEPTEDGLSKREDAIVNAFHNSIHDSLTKNGQDSFEKWWGANKPHLISVYKEKFFELINLIGSTGKSVKLDKGQIGEAFFAMLFECARQSKDQKDYLAIVQGGDRNKFGQLPVDVVLLSQFGFQIKNYTSLPREYDYFRLYETSWKLIPSKMEDNPLKKYLTNGLEEELTELKNRYLAHTMNPFDDNKSKKIRDKSQKLLLNMDSELHKNIPSFMRFADADVVDTFVKEQTEDGSADGFANVLVNHFYIVKFDIFPASVLFLEIAKALTQTVKRKATIVSGGYFGLTKQQYNGEGKAKMVDIPAQDPERNLLTEWTGTTSGYRFYKSQYQKGPGFPDSETFFKDARLFFSGIEFTNFREIADAQVKQTR